jgi:hypothetical protein
LLAIRAGIAGKSPLVSVIEREYASRTTFAPAALDQNVDADCFVAEVLKQDLFFVADELNHATRAPHARRLRLRALHPRNHGESSDHHGKEDLRETGHRPNYELHLTR